MSVRREDLLTTVDVARFAARGFLRLDEVVPAELNARFLREVEAGELPVVPAGTPLEDAYPEGSALHAIVRLPRVAGLIQSLVGPGCVFDHHFLHPALPRESLEKLGLPFAAQHTHQDSTIDPRFTSFDVQLMYYPHDVTEGMGGTRYVPGSHLRRVSESAIARYQNIRGQQKVVCPAGTVYALHHGLWHGGDLNQTDKTRTMFKIRLAPTVPQVRLWNTDDVDEGLKRQRPIFFLRERPDPEHIHSILTKPEPWFEFDVMRIEFMNRIRFFRALLGDETFDADYWLTRVENEPGARAS